MSCFRQLLLRWTFFLVLLTLGNTQSSPGEFKHELPPGVELVNPKDFGFSDSDLGKFLGNVKVLGGGQIGDTKTQILTVGFEGDEGINFDDFEIPGLTDKKATNLPEKDKEIANVAFEKFKEFFKDPKKNGKSYETITQRSLPPSSFATTAPFLSKENNNANNNLGRSEPRHQGQKQSNENVNYNQINRPSPEILQQHYPVTLTQPIHSQTTTRPIIIQHPVKNQTPQTPQNQQQPQPQYNHKPRVQQFVQKPRDQNQNQQQIPNRNQLPKNYITPMIAAQQQLQGHINHQIRHSNANNNNYPSQEFGAKIPHTPQPVQQTQRPFNFNNNHNNHNNNNNKPFVNQNSFDLQQQRKFPPPQASTISNNNNNFQTTNTYQTIRPEHLLALNKNQRVQAASDSIGQVIRNQLTFKQQTQTPQPQQRPQQVTDQYQQNTQQSPSPSSSSNSFRFPTEDPEDERPVSHVYIHRQNQISPVQQTSFHPRFQAPTRFVNNFNPSINQLTTTAIPRIEVTPSMPMILLSTNENAITDPERTERLRQQQRHREDLRLREAQRLREEELKAHEEKLRLQEQQHFQEQQRFQEQQQRQPHSGNFQIQPPRQQSQNVQQNQFTQPPIRQFNQQQNNFPPQQFNNNNNINNIDDSNSNYKQFQNQNQNSFNFKAQQQQHQLHNLQNRPQNTNPNYFQQQQTQSSNNFPRQVEGQQFQQGGFPPRFRAERPDVPPLVYSTIRHKRGGYRNRLTNILRGLWRGERN